MTAKAACAYAEHALGIAWTPNAMTKLLKRLGFVRNKPKGVAAKADAAVQPACVAETLLPLIQAASEECPLCFVDAAHPAYTGRPAHGSIRKGLEHVPKKLLDFFDQDMLQLIEFE
ncbi:MAG: helix-turn-helix domain-containing protein [Methylocella sp.]